MSILLTRAGPLVTVQEAGRSGLLRHGISASGPMDRGAFDRAAGWMGGASPAGLEFTAAGLAFRVEDGPLGAALDGGDFRLSQNGEVVPWPARLMLRAGDTVDIVPGGAGNYGYIRFDRELDLPPVLGSRATSSVTGLGGLAGRPLQAGDRLAFGAAVARLGRGFHPRPAKVSDGPIRVIWGLHADLFPAETRQRFVEASFRISARLDRMGARLEDEEGVFASSGALSLVSDAIVAGDIQILGEGTPIVLLRDHQPTGGYPRIATVISADLDRFVQLRPGTAVNFVPVSLDKAHAALKGGRR